MTKSVNYFLGKMKDASLLTLYCLLLTPYGYSLPSSRRQSLKTR